MIKVLLASESKIKEEAVKNWFSNVLNKDLVTIKKINISDSLLPPQPINTGGILSCSDRIKFVERQHKSNKYEYDYIISIENFLKVENGKFMDCVQVNIKNIITDIVHTMTGGEIEITYKNVIEYPNIVNCIDELIKNYEISNKKYIYDGCETTFGDLINKHYSDISAKNWMKTISNLNRKDQILSVLKNLNDKIN